MEFVPLQVLMLACGCNQCIADTAIVSSAKTGQTQSSYWARVREDARTEKGRLGSDFAQKKRELKEARRLARKLGVSEEEAKMQLADRALALEKKKPKVKQEVERRGRFKPGALAMFKNLGIYDNVVGNDDSRKKKFNRQRLAEKKNKLKERSIVADAHELARNSDFSKMSIEDRNILTSAHFIHKDRYAALQHVRRNTDLIRERRDVRERNVAKARGNIRHIEKRRDKYKNVNRIKGATDVETGDILYAIDSERTKRERKKSEKELELKQKRRERSLFREMKARERAQKKNARLAVKQGSVTIVTEGLCWFFDDEIKIEELKQEVEEQKDNLTLTDFMDRIIKAYSMPKCEMRDIFLVEILKIAKVRFPQIDMDAFHPKKKYFNLNFAEDFMKQGNSMLDKAKSSINDVMDYLRDAVNGICPQLLPIIQRIFPSYKFMLHYLIYMRNLQCTTDMGLIYQLHSNICHHAELDLEWLPEFMTAASYAIRSIVFRSFRNDPTNGYRKSQTSDGGYEFVTEGLDFNGFAGSMEDMMSFLKRVFSSEYVTMITKLLLSLASFKLFSRDISYWLYTIIGKPVKMTACELFMYFAECLTKMLNLAARLACGYSLCDLLLADDPVSEAVSSCRLLLSKTDQTYLGLPVPGYMNLKVYIQEGETLMEFFKTYMKKSSRRDIKYGVVEELSVKLSKDITAKKAYALGQHRQAPFGVIVHGPPGIGKSHILRWIAKIHCEIMNREYNENGIYHKDTGDFWANFQSFEHWCIHMSELGNMHLNLLKNKGDPRINELLSICDNIPYTLNTPFEDKGTVRCLAELVLIDTNIWNMQADMLFAYTSAILRRFLFIEPSVKMQYRKHDSVSINPDLCNEGDFMDRWTFDVYIHVPTVGRETQQIWLLRKEDENSDIHALTDLLRVLMYKHIVSQHEHLNNLQAELANTGKYGDSNWRKKHGMLETDLSKMSNMYMPPNKSFEKAGAVGDGDVVKSLASFGTPNLDCFTDFINSTTQSLIDKTRKAFRKNKKLAVSEIEVNLNSVEVVKPDYLQTMSPYTSGEDTTDVAEVVNACIDHIDISDGLPSFSVYSESIETQSEGYYNSILEQCIINCSESTNAAFALVVCTFMTSIMNLVQLFCTGVLRRPKVKWFISVTLFLRSLLSLLLLWYIFGSNIFVVLAGFFLIFVDMLSYAGIFSAIEFAPRKPQNMVKAGVKLYWNRFRYWFKGGVSDATKFCLNGVELIKFDRKKARGFIAAVSAIGSALVLAGGAKVVYDYVHPKHSSEKKKKNFKNEENEGLEYSHKQVNTEATHDITELNRYEKTFHCGGENLKLTKTKFGNYYNATNMITFVPPHTSSMANLDARMCNHNIRLCYIEYDDVHIKSYLLGYFGNYCIINKHVLPVDVTKKFLLRVSKTGVKKDLEHTADSIIDGSERIDVYEDISILRLTGVRFIDIREHIPNGFEELPEGLGMIRGEQVNVITRSQPIIYRDIRWGVQQIMRSYTYRWDNHCAGMCGLPLIKKYPKGSAVIGIHCAGDSNNDTAFAMPLERDVLNRAIIDRFTNDDLIQINSESVDVLPRCCESGPKSPINYIDLGHIYHFGKVCGKNTLPNGKSNFHISPIIDTEEYEEICNELELPRMPDMKPAILGPFKDTNGDYHSPWNNALAKLNCKKRALDRRVLRLIVRKLSHRIATQLKAEGIDNLRPYTLNEAVNGSPDNPFFRRIDMSTSAGFGFDGKKSKWFTLDDDGVTRIPKPEVVHAVTSALDRLYDQKSSAGVYSGCLKDEIRPMEKIAKVSTRLFMGCSLVDLIIGRMFLGPLGSLMCRFGYIFCTAIGVDALREWSCLKERLESFSDIMAEGDWSSYDCKVPDDIRWCAMSVIYRLFKLLGYPPESLVILNSVLSDMLFPYVCILAELLCIPGAQPSGAYLTAEINSLINLILFLYMWIVCRLGNFEEFFACVLPLFFGDDVLSAVKPHISKVFNEITLRLNFLNLYGMEFTASDKKETVTSTRSIHESSFLKRKFVYHEDFERYVGPLPKSSIHKTLAYIDESGNCFRTERIAGILRSVNLELSCIVSRDKHERIRKLFLRIAQKLCVDDNSSSMPVLPTFDKIREMLFDTKPAGDECTQLVETLPVIAHIEDFVTQSEDFFSEAEDTLLDFGYLNIEPLSFEEHKRLPRRKHLKFTDEKNLDLNLESLPLNDVIHMLLEYPSYYLDLDYETVRKSPSYGDYAYRSSMDRFFRLAGEVTSRLRNVSLRELLNMRGIVTEAEEVAEISKGPVIHEEKYVTILDIGGDSVDKTNIGVVYDNDVLMTTDADLDSFFMRPIEIAVVDIPMDTQYTWSNSVWQTYLNIPSVRAKLRNYAFLRGTLHVKITVVGSPYHHGSLLVAGVPRAQNNYMYAYYLPLVGTLYQQFNRWLSQIRGSRLIDVRDDKPFVITFPFISPQPMLRLFNNSSTALANTTAYNDAVNMGDLVISVVNLVNAISTGASDVSVYVYAWMEDVEVGCPSATQITITTEAENMKKGKGKRIEIDERKMGPIERYSSAAAEVSGALQVIPWVGPFATASTMMFGGLSKISALLGWSYPVCTEQPHRIKNEPFVNAANVIGFDTVQRIGLDPKQELSIDPRKCGIDTDDMHINAISSRPSIYYTGSWTPSQASMSSMFTSIVTPTAAQSISYNSHTLVQPTAVAFAARPFQYWRGKMKYKIIFFPSNFHRGRVAIVYEPNVYQISLITTSPSLNKQYMVIVDLQETNEVEICIDWAFPREWAQTLQPPYCNDCINSTTNLNYKFESCNGFFYIMPITKLVSPDGSNVDYTIYAYCDDLCVNYLDSSLLPSYVTQGEELGTQFESSCYVVNPTGSNATNISQMYFGERPVTFRNLIKRYSAKSFTTYSGTNIGDTTLTYVGLVWPTPVPTNLLGYLQYGFIGMSGGLKKRILIGGTNFRSTDHVWVTMLSPSSTIVIPSLSASSTLNGMVANETGTLMFVPGTNAGIDFEIPMYTNNLYYNASTSPAPSGDSQFLTYVTYNYKVTYSTSGTTASIGNSVVELTAAGEDFSLLNFLAAPSYDY